MFFPGLHLGPRACSPQANQQMNRGQEAGLRSACHTAKEIKKKKRETRLGFTCAEETEMIQVSAADFLSYFAKLKEPN